MKAGWESLYALPCIRRKTPFREIAGYLGCIVVSVVMILVILRIVQVRGKGILAFLFHPPHRGLYLQTLPSLAGKQ